MCVIFTWPRVAALLPRTKRNVGKSADGDRAEHETARSGEPDRNVAETIDTEEDSIGFGDDIGIRIGDRICVTTQLCDGKIIALLINRFDAMGDARALTVVHADDVTDLNFGRGHGMRECQCTGIDRGRHRSALENQRSDIESQTGDEEDDGCQPGEGSERKQDLLNAAGL